MTIVRISTNPILGGLMCYLINFALSARFTFSAKFIIYDFNSKSHNEFHMIPTLVDAYFSAEIRTVSVFREKDYFLIVTIEKTLLNCQTKSEKDLI
jgi:hypothetical protein